MQLNVWHGKLLWATTNLIKKYQPDIVCMQEVNDIEGPTGALFFGLNQIAEMTGYEHTFMTPTHTFRFMHRMVGFGNGIMSKQPFATTHSEFTSGGFIDDGDCTEQELMSRAFQHVTLPTDSGKLHVINYHGAYIPGTKHGNQAVTRQVEQIASYIQSLEGPVVLCGDLNLASDSPSLAPLGFMHNLPVEHGVSSSYQPSLSNQTDDCDYIMTYGDLRITNFQMLDELASDHKALIVDFDF